MNAKLIQITYMHPTMISSCDFKFWFLTFTYYTLYCNIIYKRDFFFLTEIFFIVLYIILRKIQYNILCIRIIHFANY